jgi:hypothetical protein
MRTANLLPDECKVEILEKIIEIEKKRHAFCGGNPFLGRAPHWFDEHLKDQISLLKWVINEEKVR